MSDLTFKEVVLKTNEVIEAFQKIKQREWNIEGNMIELSKQVGQLAKNVMIAENYYPTKRIDNSDYEEASKDEIGNELSDIFFMIIRIANHYGIDLEKAHVKELDKVLATLKGK